MATAKVPALDNKVENIAEMGPGLIPHPMAQVHEGAGVGIALTVMVLDLYMWRLGALIGIFAPCCRSVCWEGDELEHNLDNSGGVLLLLREQLWVR
jgi:hypothetical protein